MPANDRFTEEEEEHDLDDEDIDEDALEALDDEDLEDDEDVEVEELDEVAEPAVETVDEVVDVASDDDEEVVLELDDELHPDDVEEPLDVLLQERTAKATLEDEEEVEEEEVETDDRAEGPTRILPRRPGEFLCTSCFLVLPRNQLADDKRMLCRDCA